jgi:integrase
VDCPACDALRESIDIGAKLPSLTLPEAARTWLDSRRDISDATRFNYEYYIRSLVKFFGTLKLSECANKTLISMYQRERELGKIAGLGAAGASVVNHELNTLQQILVRAGLWQDLTDWYKPLHQRPSRIGRVLSEEEEIRLFQVASSDRHYWFVAYCCSLITVNTTAGPGEIRKLQLQDVDLNGRQIHIRLGAKNLKRDRALPLNDEALWAVTELHRRAREKGSISPHHYLLPRRARVRGDGWDPLTPTRSWKRAWQSLRVAAGLPHLRMYDLRHHAITRLLEDPGISDRTVIELAGHVSTRMLDIYSHQRVGAKIAAVAALSSREHVSNVHPAGVQAMQTSRAAAPGTPAVKKLISFPPACSSRESGDSAKSAETVEEVVARVMGPVAKGTRP